MDVWVNFTHATKWQAEWLFKLFFLPPTGRPSASSPNESPSLGGSAPQENLPGAGRGASAHVVPVLAEAEIDRLAQRFANAIPEGKMSV
jgi:chaperone BCS1